MFKQPESIFKMHITTNTLISSLLVLVLFNVCLSAPECHDGWTRFASSCYLLVNHIAEGWGQAENYCKLFGGYLAEINDAYENNYVTKWLSGQHLTVPLWIGGNDVEAKGVYVWTSSHQIFEFTNWYPGEPNDVNHTEDCVAMYTQIYNFKWNDYICTRKNNFICENHPKVEVDTVIG